MSPCEGSTRLLASWYNVVLTPSRSLSVPSFFVSCQPTVVGLPALLVGAYRLISDGACVNIAIAILNKIAYTRTSPGRGAGILILIYFECQFEASVQKSSLRLLYSTGYVNKLLKEPALPCEV